MKKNYNYKKKFNLKCFQSKYFNNKVVSNYKIHKKNT